MHQRERALDALLTHRRVRIHRGSDDVTVVAQHEERLLAREADEVAGFGPLDLLGRHVDASHQPALGEVEEEHHLPRAHAQQRAAEDLIGREGRLERACTVAEGGRR